MCVHEIQAVYCTTELCLSVDNFEEETKQQGRNDIGAQRSTSMWWCTFCQLLILRILT